MRGPRKRKVPVEWPDEGIPCFCCSSEMRITGPAAWRCDLCDVEEERNEYVSHLKMRTTSWCGSPLTYVDHARQDMPSPA